MRPYTPEPIFIKKIHGGRAYTPKVPRGEPALTPDSPTRTGACPCAPTGTQLQQTAPLCSDSGAVNVDLLSKLLLAAALALGAFGRRFELGDLLLGEFDIFAFGPLLQIFLISRDCFGVLAALL